MPEMRFLMLLTTFIEVIRRIRAVDRSVRNVKSSIGYGYARTGVPEMYIVL